MRQIIFFIASFAGAGMLAALQVIVAPDSPFWQWVLRISVSILFLCAIGFLIDIIRRCIRAKKNGQKNNGIAQMSQRRLECSFSKEIARCVERDVVLTTWTPTRPSIQPPNTTLTFSEPSMFIAEQQTVVLYSIRVCVTGDDYIDECAGRLISISRPDGSSDHLNVTLPFVPFEEPDANKKRIYCGNPEYLNVFYVTTDNKAQIKSHLNFPSGINQDTLFKVGEVHVLKIMVMAPNCQADTIELPFNWTGDVNTAEILEVG